MLIRIECYDIGEILAELFFPSKTHIFAVDSAAPTLDLYVKKRDENKAPILALSFFPSTRAIVSNLARLEW